jgi:hypothetical protein
VTWNAYGVAVHQQRAIWRIPIAVNIWSRVPVHFQIFGPLANDNAHPDFSERAEVKR